MALVTGSSRGIGAAILGGFARAGATCVLHYWDDRTARTARTPRPWPTKLRTLAATVHVIAADVRDPAQVQSLMARSRTRPAASTSW